ncbi:MAG: TetR/AcrR family transcriptional regulator [Myxococcota bacterium]
MTHKTPRARRHDANVGRILDAAMELVVSGGLEALSMGRLADAVDYTPGALYRYFPSKDALLAGLVAQVLDEAKAALEAAEARLPKGAYPLTRVFALAHGYRLFALEQPHAFALLAMTMAEPKVLLSGPSAAPVTERVVQTLEVLARALGDAEAHGQLEPGDVTERTLCFFATLQGLLLLHKQARFAPKVLDFERLVPAATRTLLLGWGAKARAADAALEKSLVTGEPR